MSERGIRTINAGPHDKLPLEHGNLSMIDLASNVYLMHLSMKLC